jgi:hypothetical protein
MIAIVTERSASGECSRTLSCAHDRSFALCSNSEGSEEAN